MRLLLIVVAALAVPLTFVLAADEANSDRNSEIRVEHDGQVRSEIAGLLDFEPFKRVYHKHYASAMEEMRRLKTFLARSYQVFVTAVGYSHGLKSYYLRVSEWSDLLPEELEAMKNKFVTSAMLQKVSRGGNDGGGGAKNTVERGAVLAEPNELPNKGAELKETTDELDKSRQAGSRRKKREVEGSRQGSGIKRAPAVKIDYSKQPGWKEINMIEIKREDGRTYDHLPVKGQHKQLGWLSVMVREFQIDETLARIGAQRGARRKSKANDDIVWVDHRMLGCMQPVQNQGKCGSCYVFAVIAFVEWYHCSKTFELVKLSEQFLIDCGPQFYSEYMKGCNGGNVIVANEFITNFGLEPAKHYPYFGSENQCPYKSGSDMDSVGYLRADASETLFVEMKFAEHYINRWPLLVDIQTADDFMWYGGGVWAGESCNQELDHTVLMVGHGREDGEEYWLIRNSHGPGWGERGYLKLNKNSKCIDSMAFIFGTSDGIELNMSISRNDKVPEPARPRPSLLDTVLNSKLAFWSN